MKIIKNLLLFIFLALFILSARGQDSTEINKRWIVSAVPQHLMNKGIRIDVEKQLNRINQYLLVGLLYYQDDEENNTDIFTSSSDYNIMTGYGVKAFHKVFFSPDNFDAHGAYVSYGGSFEHFNFSIPQASWQEFENNLYTYERSVAKQNNLKFGLSLLVGLQSNKYERFIYDFFGGIGFRYTAILSELEQEETFRTTMWDYGYSGPLIIFGFRMGGVLSH